MSSYLKLGSVWKLSPFLKRGCLKQLQDYGELHGPAEVGLCRTASGSQFVARTQRFPEWPMILDV